MRARWKSNFANARDIAPVLAVIGIGITGVFVAMNVLVTAVLVLTDDGPSPTVSVPPSFASSQSLRLRATPTPLVTPAPSASLPDAGPTLIHSAVSATDPHRNWTVYLLYPTFLAGTTPWADAIDADISSEVETRALQWEFGPAANQHVQGKANTLTGDFTTDLLTPELASFTLTWTDDSSTVEPALGVETLNYDLGTGQRMALSDVFTDPTAALAIISANALSMLQSQLGAAYNPAIAVEGTSPSPTNYNHWAITPDGVKITFAQYQVAPGHARLPAVVVPWSALRQLIVKAGPVATLAGV